MTDKEMRKLKRVDLLELLIAQIKENELLKKQLDEALAKLAEQDMVLDQAGSIAEVAMGLNKVFEAAQAAADQYLAGVKTLAERKRQDQELMAGLLEEGSQP